MHVCGRCGSENPEGFKFCGACGAPLDIEQVQPREERKIVSVLFTDIVGSTARAENLDPEDVRALLAPYYARLRQELERFGGTVEKFIGDAVVAVFGAPVAHEDDPERAVRAALGIRSAIQDLNEADAWLDLHIRTGINTGEALVVLDARPIEGQGMVAGDVINTAARLQSSAPVDGILVGELTYRATARSIDYTPAEPVQAKGKSAPLQVWEAVAINEPPSSAWTPRNRLIGRGGELNRLHENWDRVTTSRRPALVTIVGAPGVGKSRLLAEFANRVGETGTVYRGRCLSYGGGITYWPIIDMLKKAAGILQSDDSAILSTKLERLLDGLGVKDQEDLRTIASALANLLDVPTTRQGAYDAAQITQAELHWGIRRLLQFLAERSPVLLLFEDLHWAEPTLLELIRYICDPDADYPILVVASARPEFLQDSARGPGSIVGHDVVRLEALGADESRAFLDELGELRGLSESALENLLQTAGGNPLFLEETVQMLVEAGAGHEGDSTPLDLAGIGIPTNLQALINARLDQLPVEEKAVVQRASVAGSIFWQGAVAHLDGTNEDLVQCLTGLEQRDFVHARTTSTVAGEREYAFKHILIRDLAYGQLPKGQRTKLHVRFADWIYELPGTDDEFIEIIAYHLEQACRLAQEIVRSPVTPPVIGAVRALISAGEKAERREGMHEADRFYERALEILGDKDPQIAVDLDLRRAKMLAARGELRPATTQLAEIAERSLAVARPDLRCDALIALANVDQKQGRAGDARRRLLEAESLASEVGDRRLQIRSGYESAELRADFDGEDEAAIHDLRRSLDLATNIDDRALRIEGHLRIGILLLNAGELTAAQEELLHCSLLAAEMGSRRDEARADYALGVVKYYLGELDAAKTLGFQARASLERTRDSYFQIQNLLALALHALGQDAPAEAEKWLAEALPLALEGGGWLVVEIYRHMVEALVRMGRLDDAGELAIYARKSVPEEDLNALAAVAIADAHVATARGSKQVALDCFTEAVGLLAAQESPLQLAETRVAYARALHKFGEEQGARTEFRRARATFERMGARALLAEIDRELERDL